MDKQIKFDIIDLNCIHLFFDASIHGRFIQLWTLHGTINYYKLLTFIIYLWHDYYRLSLLPICLLMVNDISILKRILSIPLTNMEMNAIVFFITSINCYPFLGV